jgi:hypothetical protein
MWHGDPGSRASLGTLAWLAGRQGTQGKAGHGMAGRGLAWHAELQPLAAAHFSRICREPKSGNCAWAGTDSGRGIVELVVVDGGKMRVGVVWGLGGDRSRTSPPTVCVRPSLCWVGEGDWHSPWGLISVGTLLITV